MNKGTDLMIDLETLGTRAGCVVWEIGALAFVPATGEELESRSWLIDVPSAAEAGLVIDEETARWWQDRGGIRRTGAVDLGWVAGDFVGWVTAVEPERVWSRGASFDFPILAAALEAVGKREPWSYWQQCCQRTAWKLAFGETRPERKASHEALDDCRNQVAQLVEALAVLGKGVAR